MTLAAGARIGPYEISAKLGEGGMGEVWRARDSNLQRDVAIKVLPAAFVEDRERLARFEREAQLLAQLHHPNIASIFGLEKSGDARALVLELVDGPTLAERLAAGPLPLDEALAIARQIAVALEAAHEKGIVHRDLKPQNVKASLDGTVKVLDFGLAKAMDPAGSASGSGSASQLAHSPTLTMGATVQGMILGTAAYMAPEQAKGLPIDKRADIWAFGVVLYEMLIGGSLFGGDTVGDTLAAVIRADIELEKLPESTPAAIRRLLRRCLERNPKNRLHDIADARIVIDEVLAGGAREEPAAAAPAAVGRAPWLAAAVALAAGIGLGALLFRGGAGGSAERDGARHLELEVAAPPGTSLVSGLAIAPDGSRLALVARGRDGRTRLWVRDLETGEARELPNTLDARYPFWAPDGRRLGFFAQRRLKTIDLLGGSPRAIAETGSTQDARGGAWSADDRIVFAPTFTGGLSVVGAEGGEAVAAVGIAEGSGIGTLRFPSFLPDGKRFVFYASTGTGVEPGEIRLGRLGSNESKRLGRASSAPQYAAPGYLVYVQGDALVAHRFDDRAEELVGAPLPLGISLPGSVSVSGQRSLSLSTDGLLVYRADKRNATSLVWVDRAGRELGALADDGGTWHYAPTLSPDGRRLAVSHYEPGSTSGGVWIHDLERNLASRLTFEGGNDDTLAIWSPDSEEIAFSSVRSAPPSGVFRIGVRQTGGERPWVTGDGFLAPNAWIADGPLLVYSTFDAAGQGALWLRSFAAGGATRRLSPEHVSEWGAVVSGDGRWIAYVSDATGRPEVYARRLDAEPGAAVRVSVEGGAQPAWRGDGREIFYIDDSGRLMAVPFEPAVPPRVGAATPLFEARLEEAADRQYDATADGRRFILNRTQTSESEPVSVIVGWPARLRGGDGR